MTKLETENVISPNNYALLFEFLNDLNNYERLIPADLIENWQANERQCTFNLKGIGEMGLQKKDVFRSSTVTLGSLDNSPFKFELQMQLKEMQEKQTMVKVVFEGKINIMMKVMIERPLGNFLDKLAQKLTEINL